MKLKMDLISKKGPHLSYQGGICSLLPPPSVTPLPIPVVLKLCACATRDFQVCRITF